MTVLPWRSIAEAEANTDCENEWGWQRVFKNSYSQTQAKLKSG
jgi:hypothetical protein